jgi:hypothetical protein
MAPTIRVDDDVYTALQARAMPFQDTPNSVMRRVLGLPQAPDPSGEGAESKQHRSAGRASRPRPRSGLTRRAAKGSILAESEYEIPLLQALAELGGSASAADVLRLLGPKIEARLTDLDREPLPSGRLRWHNRAQFARLNLVRRGELDPESPRGVWQITEAGRMRLRDSA